MEPVYQKGVKSQRIGEHFRDKLTCSKLGHFTENEFAASIALLDTDESFCFKPYPWFTNKTNPLKLTWWAPILPDNWNKNRNGFASPAMGGSLLCGPIGFVAKWKDILDEYVKERGETAGEALSFKLELRNLGTYRYPKEIMYAVLVCMEGDITDNRFPLISPNDETEAISFQNNSYSNDFIWKVHSTTTGSGKTWDHLTFAFNCPNSNFNIQPKFFSINSGWADKYRPQSRDNTSKRTDTEMEPCTDTIARLEEKIRNA